MMDLPVLLHNSPMNLRSGQQKWHFFSLRVSQPAGDNQTLDVTKVCLGVFRTHDNIIQVHNAAVSEAAPLHMYHQLLEGGLSAIQTKMHKPKVEQYKICEKHHQGLGVRVDFHVPITTVKI